MNNQESELMNFFLKEAGRLAKERKNAGFDHNHENGTYTQGYYHALIDITKVMVKKANL